MRVDPESTIWEYIDWNLPQMKLRMYWHKMTWNNQLNIEMQNMELYMAQKIQKLAFYKDKYKRHWPWFIQ